MAGMIFQTRSSLAVRGILNFLAKEGILEYHGHDGYISAVVDDTERVSVRTGVSGIFEGMVQPGQEITRGQPPTYASTAVFKRCKFFSVKQQHTGQHTHWLMD